MKGTFDKKSHITGERNLSNIDGDVFSPDRKSNINYNRSETSTSYFLFGITLIVLLVGELLFGKYVLDEIKFIKQEVKIERETFNKYVQDKLDIQKDLINQFIITYGGK